MSMGVGTKLPQNVVVPIVEWRADRIDDPVEKLRFLRLAMGTEWEAAAPRQQRGWWASGAAAFALAFSLGLPLPTASDTTQVTPVKPPVEHIVPVSARSTDASTGIRPIRTDKVWVVESTDEYEIYSNGLRIENEYQTSNQMRFFQVYDRQKQNAPVDQWRSQPVGIVFHTTESHITPFAEDHTKKMKQIGAGLLAGIRQNRSYHFVIDRFGRVFRVVEESDSANHAGNSIWADDRWTYLNLNNSFLGVAFEAQTRENEEQATSVTPAQIHAARVLTQLLRSKYGIPSRNCVTHAQVSVNPSNMQVGYHTDWAGNFPFQELDLEENYAQPLPSVFAFGFEYNANFVKQTGPRMLRGLTSAEQELRQRANSLGITVAEHRSRLQQQYRTLLTALKAESASKEKKSGAQ